MNVTDNLTAVMRGLAKSGMTMLVVTHEMDFARDVSNRIFYMDEGGIYEEGSPEEIFTSPKKEKTQIFIYNIHTYSYEITSRDFDFVEMLGGVENFCFRNAIERKTANRLQLLAEELVINIVTPAYGECSLNMSFSEKQGAYGLSVSYKGEKSNALETAEDTLSATVARKSAKEICHEFKDGVNTITAQL
jgi:polar amino acid transport system ATP-binding protein